MTFLIETARHTPPYVFVALAFLVWQGVRSLKPQVQSFWQMMLVPAAFAAASVLFMNGGGSGTGATFLWAGSACAFAPLGNATAPRLVAIEPRGGRVVRDGSPVPLVRNLVIFVVQYGLAIAIARHLMSADWAANAAHAVSGSSTGYFAGWVLASQRRYRRLRCSPLGAAERSRA